MRAQLLDARRPVLISEVIDELTLLNIDPTNAIAPSEDHILWARLGNGYEPAQLRSAAPTIARQWSQHDARAGSGTPSCS